MECYKELDRSVVSCTIYKHKVCHCCASSSKALGSEELRILSNFLRFLVPRNDKTDVNFNNYS